MTVIEIIDLQGERRYDQTRRVYVLETLIDTLGQVRELREKAEDGSPGGEVRKVYKPVDPKDIPSGRIVAGLAYKDVLDFAETSYKAAEITIPAGSTSKKCYQNYVRAIKRAGLSEKIKVVQRQDRAYMIKVAKQAK